MSKTMKNIFLRSFSALLVFITVFGMLAGLSMIPVFADTTTGGTSNDDGSQETVELSYDEYLKSKYILGVDYDENGKEIPVDFSTADKRLAAMGDPYIVSGDFALYVDEATGEIAVKDNSTGDILFTNPYDLSTDDSSDDTKMAIMSQVYITYTENGNNKEYYSFEDSALLGQIDVKRLRGGICVEYSIGEEESRTLVPRVIEKSRFETAILQVMAENMPDGVNTRKYQRMLGFYVLYDPNKPMQSENVLATMYKNFPVTMEGMAVYAFDQKAARREIKLIESYIKEYCPEYTYEQLDADHAMTKYEATNLAPANFRMALEYYLNDNGVEVRFPANSLRFDESNFQLTNIAILQYMGAGSDEYEGYTMIPDGAGTLIRYEDVESPMNLTGKLYGQDYAYQEIGNANQEVYRMPVFGLVTSNTLQEGVAVDPGKEYNKYSSGYVAIITEGDALTNITSTHGGGKINSTHKYNACYPSFYPRPKDSYNLAEAISIGSNTTYTVVSERKYTGSYRIQYIMLTDPENVENRNPERTYYDSTYVGMAKAYREYLVKSDKLTQLTTDKVQSNIPLYIESFGTTETDETFLSIPVTVKKALTSFENLTLMAKELRGDLLTKEEICELMDITAKEYDEMGMTPEKYQAQSSKIENLNFKLTGFTNGGMLSTVPTKVKFEKAAGGNNGYKTFLQFASDNGIGVYPDFDFVYMSDTSLFDGFRYKRDAVKTIDNRYISKRSYDAVLQSFTVDGKICISASVFRDYFDKFQKSMNKILGDLTTGISVGTLGSDLNSDFDEDEPYNREDIRDFTEEMLAQITNTYGSVMLDSGNAYAIPYADILLNVSLDSSRYLNASEAIPFFGMVYHGFVVFAGTPTNMAGDFDYELLKIIENGATLYMMLSYDNIELLKEDPVLSKYYAISYDIWKDSLISKYDENGNLVSLGVYDMINGALKDVQTALINNHLFITADRDLSQVELDSIKADADRAYKAAYDAKDVLYKNACNKLNDYRKLVELYGLGTKEFKEACAAYGLASEAAIQAEIDRYLAERDAIDYNEYYNAEYVKINTFVDDGSVVYVEYDNGHWFVLNYNDFNVTVVSPADGSSIKVGAKSYFDSNANA